MSAAEIIEEAKRLSREDRERVIESLLEVDSPQPMAMGGPNVDWSGAIDRARAILGDCIVPNMILEERESYKY